MTLRVEVTGASELVLENLMLDLNGTINAYGSLIEGVAERVGQLRSALSIGILSADTLGTAAGIAERLNVNYHTLQTPPRS